MKESESHVVNERSTEEIVRQHLKDHPSVGQTVEEQTSTNPLIRRALAAASKSGNGAGKPEFIVTFEDSPRLVLVIECKADPAKHVSASGDNPAHYAVDGVLRYAEHLSTAFDVIAVAVSGTRADDLRVSTFRRLRGALESVPLTTPHGTLGLLVPVDEYRRHLTYDPAVRARTEHELLTFSRELHNYMRDYAGLSEAEKPLVVSGILLALKDAAFRASWSAYSPKDLAKGLLDAGEVPR
ncbi:hypothetical protein [Microbacterium sp. NPDC087591]|uniref:hypothetical protein n=1 Tax=Microbacterium sp. NPDC087591 TaxID=3364192 RepID=UPI0038093018